MFATDKEQGRCNSAANLSVFFFFLIILQLPSCLWGQVLFTPRFTATGEYTDNVFRTPHNKEDEFITTLSPGATLEIVGKIAGLNLEYDPEYAVYRDNHENDGWRHFANLTGWWDLNRRTRIDVSDTLVISEDPADDEADRTLRTGRNRYFRNSANINLNHQFGREDFFDLGYTYTFLENEEDFEEDSFRHNSYADVTWWFMPNVWGLDLHGDYTRGEFDTSDDFDSWRTETRLRRRITRNTDLFLQYAYLTTRYDGDSENYNVHDIGVGFSHRLGENIDTTFAVSYIMRDQEESEDEGRLVAAWDIDALWEWRRTTLELTGASGYEQDTFGAENNGFHLYSEVDGSVTYRITRSVSGDIFGGYRFNRYLDFDPEIEDHDVHGGAGISWRVLEWMRFRVQYSHSRIISNEEEREYEENRIFGSIVLRPTLPFKMLK